MNSTKILPPHIPYTLPCSFGAIDHARIYVGQYGTDPTVVANRIPIYIMDINGKMTRVEQPIITNSAGQSMYNDVPTNFYCFDRYSIMVQNAYGDKLYFEMIPGGEFGIPARFDFRTGGTVTTHDTVVFHPAAPGTNHYYFWEGALPKTVPANSAPTPLGPGFWVDVALRLTQDGYDDDYDDVLRFELGANSGATLVGTSTGENVEERITNLTPEDIGAQPVDATLTAIAGVPTSADKIIYFNGVDTALATTLTGFGRTLIDDADAAAARTTLGAQPLDATLTAMAGVATSADKIIYFNGVDTAVSTTLTGFGRTLIDDADAATARGTLGAQAADATLTAMAGVTTAADRIIYFNGVDTATSTPLTGFGRSLIDDVDAAAGRTTLGAAATVHTHAVGDITGLQGALDGKLSLTGGTMTGDLTAPNVIVTTAPSADNHATTKSYVDTSITTAIDSVPLDDYLPISGGAIHGNLAISPPEGGNGLVLFGQPTNLPYVLGTSSGVTGSDWYLGQFGESTDVFLSNFDLTNYIALKSGYAESGLDLRIAGTQGTEPNSLTRRDFVETSITGAVSNKVDKAGDVMTGGLQALNFQARDIEQGLQGIRISGDANYSEVIPVDSAGSVLWTESLRYLPDTGKWTAQVQGTEPTSLTTKQYVDDAIAAGGGGGMEFIELGVVDLNTITTPGYYIQSSFADAQNGSNYPVNDPTGVLVVYPAPMSVDADPDAPVLAIQFYYKSNSYSQYTRNQFSDGDWSSWGQIYTSLAPPSLASMGADDYGLGGETPWDVEDCNTTSAVGENGGWYQIKSTTTNTPYTTGDPKTNYAVMHTLSSQDKNKTQIFYAAGPDPETWIRNVYDDAGVKTRSPWVKVFPAAGGSTTLGGLTDVADTVTSATEGQVLTYNATSLEWEAKTPAAGGGVTYIELADNVNLDTVTTPGFYQQSSKAAVTTALKYPVGGYTGVLHVYAGSDDIDTGGVTQITQVYITWGSQVQYTRFNSGSTWTNWGTYFTELNKPSALDVGVSVYGLAAAAPATVPDCNATSSVGQVGGWQKVTATTTNAPYPVNDPKLNLSVLFTMSTDGTHRVQWFHTTDGSNEIWYRSQYYDGSTRIFMPWAKIFPSAVTLEDVDLLRAENQSLRDRVDALEQLVNQILVPYSKP